MRTYISYSISEDENYIISLLSKKIRENNFSIFTNQANTPEMIKYYVRNTDLFIGIISAKGKRHQEVIKTWEIAKKKVPSLLLVENTINIKGSTNNVIIFDRLNPQIAIDSINQHIEAVDQKKPKQVFGSRNSKDNSFAWLMAGTLFVLAVGLFANNQK